MKQTTKVIFLVLAFVFPVCIFVFLKMFGRNEFDVPPLYATEPPKQLQGCDHVPSLPYVVPDTVQRGYGLSADSLTVIFFGTLSGEELNQFDRVKEQTVADPVQVMRGTEYRSLGATTVDVPVTPRDSVGTLPASAQATNNDAVPQSIRRCIFFLDNDLNVVMVNRRGVIRGQYSAADRDDIDRLLTEITILLKKY